METPKIDAAALRERWRAAMGWIAIALGAIALIAGWVGVSGETLVAKQLPYLLSGGLGGVGFLGAGIGLLIAEDLRAERARLGRLESEMLELRDLLRALVEQRGARAS